MHSSEEWQERGAASGTRKEVDANGNVTYRQVKKGVKDFHFGRTLGEGSYSTVLFAEDCATRRPYAIKVLDKKHIIKEEEGQIRQHRKRRAEPLDGSSGGRQALLHIPRREIALFRARHRQ